MTERDEQPPAHRLATRARDRGDHRRRGHRCARVRTERGAHEDPRQDTQQPRRGRDDDVLRVAVRAGVGTAASPDAGRSSDAHPDDTGRRLALGERTVPRRVPGAHRRRRVRHGDRRGPIRGRLPHRARAEPVPVGVRTRVRGAVRAGVPARLGRRARVDPGAEAVRDRALRCRELRREHDLARGARRGAARFAAERRRDRRRPGRTRRRVRPSARRPSGHGLRGPGSTRRDDGARHPRVPAAARADRARDRGDRRARHRRRDRTRASAKRTRSTELLDRHAALFLAVGTGIGRDLELARTRSRRCAARRRVPAQRQPGLPRRARRAGRRRRRRQRRVRRGPDGAARASTGRSAGPVARRDSTTTPAAR